MPSPSDLVARDFETLYHNRNFFFLSKSTLYLKSTLISFILIKDLLPYGDADISEEFLKQITDLMSGHLIKSVDRNEKVIN